MCVKFKHGFKVWIRYNQRIRRIRENARGNIYVFCFGLTCKRAFSGFQLFFVHLSEFTFFLSTISKNFLVKYILPVYTIYEMIVYHDGPAAAAMVKQN